ncbi:hypothetical protein LET06_03090 [Pectobacterium versatile]|uniref:hypothetical protein n=1 Tax=Pectobacterium TaxID=122277 RepID=UPI001CE0ACD8|nr:hypothetical protein [Pectobacterium versatile]MCA5929950.1 hypothetical protein [Pectobacterium versatile]MCA5947146.1 hypothetical protein [Pectobacterium versatile]MCA5951566.1 hypothetical protein [Pectobacterium versatile]UCP86687.1 hypothetical protein LGL96_03375 [Pectobacterium versatile]
MKNRYYSIIFATRNIIEADVMKDLGNNIRFINMSVNPRGFAGNKGLTNNFFQENKEFVWTFESREQRESALKRLNQIVSKNVLYTMKVKTLISPLRAAMCNSIRQPKMTDNLRKRWQHLVSRSTVIAHNNLVI